MESSSNGPSPFVPAAQVPLHRNPPLAPSQELAYREKCIALKRRLTEIENNNDSLRKRLEREKRFQDKMRLNRAILLNHLKEMNDNPDAKLSQQELENLRLGLHGSGNLAEHLGYDLNETPGLRGNARSDYIMEDNTSADSEEDLEPELREQPTSRKRARHSATVRDTPMSHANSVAATPLNVGSTYHQTSLPSLAPARSYSPLAHPDPPMLTSSFRVSSSGHPAGSPLSTTYAAQQATPYTHPHSPTTAQPYATPTPAITPVEPAPIAPPVRPLAPYEQFTAHMTPQLARDNYGPEEMSEKILELWKNMENRDRGLWDQRYHEQMIEYEKGMDEWKRGQRKGGSSGFAAVNNR